MILLNSHYGIYLVEKIIYLPNEEIEEYLNDERLKNNNHISKAIMILVLL